MTDPAPWWQGIASTLSAGAVSVILALLGRSTVAQAKATEAARVAAVEASKAIAEFREDMASVLHGHETYLERLVEMVSAVSSRLDADRQAELLQLLREVTDRRPGGRNGRPES